MTRPQFITALNELGLNPKQAMDRLSVRSLEGLNLREALEALRRQMLQDAPASPAAAEPEPEPVVETRHVTPEPEPVAQATPPRYFDEEDDPDLIFTVDEPGYDEEDEFAPSESVADRYEDEDELDLEDVPDFPAPPMSAPPVTASQMPRKTASARTSEAPATPASAAAPAQSAPDRARAMQLVGKLRSAQGGGPASDYQRKAYHNLVEGQLDEEQATSLVRGLWRIPPARLTSDQFDALIRWGKEDDFVEEAELVLATLRAEQARAADANGASASSATEQAPSSTPPRTRPARGASAASARQGSAR
jgi:ribosomal protein L12E/L44/L45/RPP1/RPP2